MTAKRYYIDLTQMRSAVKPAQFPRRFHSERRIWFWRLLFAGVFVSAACAFLLLEFGFFDFAARWAR